VCGKKATTSYSISASSFSLLSRVSLLDTKWLPKTTQAVDYIYIYYVTGEKLHENYIICGKECLCISPSLFFFLKISFTFFRKKKIYADFLPHESDGEKCYNKKKKLKRTFSWSKISFADFFENAWYLFIFFSVCTPTGATLKWMWIV
jgi:hypothetical protein